jgi:hypothetical protein
VAGLADAEITLDADRWKELGRGKRIGLIDHELTHIELVYDDDGLALDDNERPKLKLRKHDYEFGWFNEVVERHGNDSLEREQAARLLYNAGQLYFPGFESDGALSTPERVAMTTTARPSPTPIKQATTRAAKALADMGITAQITIAAEDVDPEPGLEPKAVLLAGLARNRTAKAVIERIADAKPFLGTRAAISECESERMQRGKARLTLLDACGDVEGVDLRDADYWAGALLVSVLAPASNLIERAVNRVTDIPVLQWLRKSEMRRGTAQRQDVIEMCEDRLAELRDPSDCSVEAEGSDHA